MKSEELRKAEDLVLQAESTVTLRNLQDVVIGRISRSSEGPYFIINRPTVLSVDILKQWLDKAERALKNEYI